MDDFLKQTPPDDTGSKTLERYRYQAQIAIPFCIDCVIKQDVVSVIMEHFEDIVVEYQKSWHFIQVKSRNANLGPWKLRHAWDGIKSLYRSYKKTSCMQAQYSLFLEGASARDDDINLIKGTKEVPIPVIKKGIEVLNISTKECKDFFAVLSIQPYQTSRTEITNHNISLLGQIAPGISATELREHEKRLTDELFHAMSADRLGDGLYTYMSNTSELEQKLLARVRAKRLDREAISAVMGSLAHGSSPLLKRQPATPTSKPMSKLEQKLFVAGASERIIERAKSLRANTAIREAEILSSGLFGNDRLEDIQERLITFATALVEQYDLEEKPAKIIWGELLKELRAEKDLVDPNLLYSQDAFLLLGAVCELSDQCRIDWGVPLA